MAQKQTLRVQGYREFVRACALAGPETKREVRNTFREVGNIVRDDAKGKLDDISASARTVTGIRTIVRQRGVSVEQTRRKTTGLRPDWGDTQMRRLVAALEEKEPEVDRAMEHAIDKVVDHFTR